MQRVKAVLACRVSLNPDLPRDPDVGALLHQPRSILLRPGI